MNQAQIQQSAAQSGASYFMQGFKLIRTKGIRRYVFVPLVVNLILFAFAFYQLSFYIDDWIVQLEAWLPAALSWLIVIVEPLIYIAGIIAASFVFSTVANWLAAPFNGLLSEKIEQHLTGQSLSEGGFVDIVKDIPRTLYREWRKLVYYIPRALVFFLVFLFVPFVGQIIWFAFIAWMMAIQYCDYPFDNHKIDFQTMRSSLSEKRGKCFSFGLTVSLFAIIPIVNLVLMPVAICGATAMWVDHFRRDHV